MPNGSLIQLRVRRMGDRWIVSDDGAALDEAMASGVDSPTFSLNVRRAVRQKGLEISEGRIESPRVGQESLFNAVVVVANAVRDIADAFIMIGDPKQDGALDKRTRSILVHRFPSWVSRMPLYINGASERIHKIDNVLMLPDGRKLLVDTVKHQGNSINSAVVSNLDIARLNDPKIVQRIVFDADEKWKPEEIELLEVGARPVAVSSLGDAIARLAA
jgi:hypothetical protein